MYIYSSPLDYYTMKTEIPMVTAEFRDSENAVRELLDIKNISIFNVRI